MNAVISSSGVVHADLGLLRKEDPPKDVRLLCWRLRHRLAVDERRNARCAAGVLLRRIAVCDSQRLLRGVLKPCSSVLQFRPPDRLVVVPAVSQSRRAVLL